MIVSAFRENSHVNYLTSRNETASILIPESSLNHSMKHSGIKKKSIDETNFNPVYKKQHGISTNFKKMLAMHEIHKRSKVVNLSALMTSVYSPQVGFIGLECSSAVHFIPTGFL